MIAEIGRTHGRLDGLVNAAGIAALGNIEDTDFATWRKVMAVNLDGTFLGCKHGLALLKQRGGAIVNLSSVAGLIGGHNLAAYNASKGGVRLLTKSVALHGARLDPQVRCNSVHPAFLEGPMVDLMLQETSFPDAARARITRDIPLGRLGTRGRGRRDVRLSAVGRIPLRHRRRIRHRRRPDRALSLASGDPLPHRLRSELAADSPASARRDASSPAAP